MHSISELEAKIQQKKQKTGIAQLEKQLAEQKALLLKDFVDSGLEYVESDTKSVEYQTDIKTNSVSRGDIYNLLKMPELDSVFRSTIPASTFRLLLDVTKTQEYLSSNKNPKIPAQLVKVAKIIAKK